MKLEDLKDWSLSQYNENTEYQLDYYINESKCKIGDADYLYTHQFNELWEMKINHIIRRSDNPQYYDNLDDDILIYDESKYGADSSAELITDNDCYLIWFEFI